MGYWNVSLSHQKIFFSFLGRYKTYFWVQIHVHFDVIVNLKNEEMAGEKSKHLGSENTSISIDNKFFIFCFKIVQ